MHNLQFIIHSYWIWFYLATVNFVSAIVFTYDKKAAIKKQKRVSEKTLHVLEILGGAFINLLLMYVLRHKNRKFSYWVWTWVVAIGWIVLLTYNLTNK